MYCSSHRLGAMGSDGTVPGGSPAGWQGLSRRSLGANQILELLQHIVWGTGWGPSQLLAAESSHAVIWMCLIRPWHWQIYPHQVHPPQSASMSAVDQKPPILMNSTPSLSWQCKWTAFNSSASKKKKKCIQSAAFFFLFFFSCRKLYFVLIRQ